MNADENKGHRRSSTFHPMHHVPGIRPALGQARAVDAQGNGCRVMISRQRVSTRAQGAQENRGAKRLPQPTRAFGELPLVSFALWPALRP